MHVTIQKRQKIAIHSAKKAQIEVRALLFNKTFTTIPAKYSNYRNVFLAENITEFLKYIEINNYVIKQKKGKQLFFSLIYNLGTLKSQMLKIYIKTNLDNCFI